MKKRDLKITILRLLMGGELHGYEIGKQLSSRGLSGQLSYIYQVLSEMRKELLIKSIWKKSPNGPKRKVYVLAAGGRQELQNTLKDLVGSVHEFYSEYLAQLPPEKWLLKWERLITDTMRAPKTVVFVVDRPSALRVYQYTLEYYCKKLGGDVYLVKDKAVGFNLTLDNLVSMTGGHTKIPLRRDFADLVIAFDPPKPDALFDAVAEFHRVVKVDGLAAMGYPHIEEQEDPLTIGAFIERIQYGMSNQEFPDEETIRSTFTNHFQIVNTTKVANFTFFTGRQKIISKT